MRSRYFLLAMMTVLAMPYGYGQAKSKLKPVKTNYEEVSFEDLIHRYLAKTDGGHTALEGIYSVSCVITTRNKKMLSDAERVRVVERKDNYARVAILKDWPTASRDFIEVSLSYRDAKRYPIVGEINLLAEGGAMIYKHLEPDGETMSFSMVHEPSDILEGEYSYMKKRKTITYKISYIKIYPKKNDLVVELD